MTCRVRVNKAHGQTIWWEASKGVRWNKLTLLLIILFTLVLESDNKQTASNDDLSADSDVPYCNWLLLVLSCKLQVKCSVTGCCQS